MPQLAFVCAQRTLAHRVQRIIIFFLCAILLQHNQREMLDAVRRHEPTDIVHIYTSLGMAA